jgi:hypothetical protein
MVVPLIEGNRQRNKQALEYELLDTGIFDEHRYFDVFVEYAKVEPEDLLIQIKLAGDDGSAFAAPVGG